MWKLLRFRFFFFFFASAVAFNRPIVGDHPLKLPCEPPEYASLPFCNTSLPFAARAQALVAALTLQEKIQQLSNNASAIPRLGLPAYEWWSESLHGLAPNGPGVDFLVGPVRAATGFPQVILSAAAFNRTLWRALAAAIAVEARAMHSVGQAGLTFWAPNINVFRDPRWGRGQETPGEDPLVAAEYAVQYVKGFQGEYAGGGHESSIMLSACCKHYTAYDLEKWGNFSRYTFNAQVTAQDMADTFQPPFQSCVQEGRASCLMCSYNQINGVPACARGDLIEQARKEWGFQGYVTSDCDAVAIIHENQNYTASPEDSIADVLKAGMDINCGTYLLRYTESAVKLGKIREEDIDRALLNLFTVQLRLGLFDGDRARRRFGRVGPKNVCTREHRQLALEAARQGIVLLKNHNGFLPLTKDEVNSVAVIGPAADDASIYGGDYAGVPCDPVSFFEGLRSYVPRTSSAPGCTNVPCNSTARFEEAVAIAKEADIVVVVAGLNQTEETEDHDRVSLLLPGKQTELVKALAGVSKRPVVLVLLGGGPMDVSFAKDDPSIASILWVGYPGEIGGQALAEALFGDFNPGGRVPVTWYPESFTKVPMNDMRMRPDPSRGYPGRTYRFYAGEAIYEFGYGLSYSSYSYEFLSVPGKISLWGSAEQAYIDKEPSSYAAKDGLDALTVEGIPSCDALRFHMRVRVVNGGGMDGSHAVLVFSRPRAIGEGFPRRQLIGFDRVWTEAGGAAEAGIVVDPCKHLSTVNVDGKRVVALGVHVLMVGELEQDLLVEA